MTQALTTSTNPNSDVIESVITAGDLSKLNPVQRVNYYTAVCQSVGLNPLTKPFEYITLNGKMVLYARKDATDQLRDIRKVSITRLERERIDSVYVVTAYAQTFDGRTDSSMGAVNIEGLKGDALANALMKSETKAKRRVTLSICGLGMLDETELGTIPDARPANVNLETGEIVPPARTVTIERPAVQPKPSAGPTVTPEPATETANGGHQRPHWNSVDDAVLWGYDQGAFKAVQHSQNAYNKLRDEAKASDNPPKNAKDMFDRWHADVLLRLEKAKAATITDAELDGTDDEGDELPVFESR